VIVTLSQKVKGSPRKESWLYIKLQSAVSKVLT